MPTPGKGEERADFVSRCVPIVLDEGTAESQEQAVAICSSMWDRKNKEAAMPDDDAVEVIDEDVIKALGDGSLEESETDLRGVACNLIGEEEGDLNFFGKKRSDEEDAWPEKTERSTVEKAQGESQAIGDEETFMEILDPPLSLQSLVTIYEESNCLRQNVDSMVTNVDGFGFALEPVIPFDSKGFRDLLSDQIQSVDEEVSDDAIDSKLKEVKKEIFQEKRRLQQFFAFSADESFTELRRASREDLEVLGNFTWEVLRGEDDEITRFVHIPFYTVRLVKKDDLAVEVETKRKIDPIVYKDYEEKKKFRRFIQMVNQKTIWFKEFGDPRPMSKKDGTYYEKEETLEARAQNDPDEGLASEILHYKIRALRGVYGLPRWIGNLLSVRGSRLSEEVNFFYFHNKGIPPMIIFVENGKLQSGAADKLADFMKQVKGDTKKFWRIAVLEGESSDDARKRNVTWTGQPRFKVVKLSSEQLKDGLFQEYDERNRDKVGESFRLPRLLRGDTRDFNRATAETAKTFAEEQVFQPERDRFDAWINRVLGPELDMKYWVFKTLSPIVREPTILAEMVTKLTKAGVLVPKEGRKIAEDMFNREFEELDEEWVERPLALTLAELMRRQPESESAVTPPDDVIRTLDKLLKGGEIDGVLGLGMLGSRVNLPKTVERLLEIDRELSSESMLPDNKEGDREGD